MANGGLLQSIINPAQADVLGALDQGRERQATDLAGELLGQTIGGKIGELAQLSPDKAIKFAEVTGTPLTSQGRIKNLIGINVMGAKLIQAGQIQEALQFVSEEADKIEAATGEPATTLRSFLAAASQGDQQAIENFMNTGLSFEPTQRRDGKPAEQKAFEALTEGLSEEDRVKATRIKLRLDPGAQGSAIQTIADRGTANVIAETEQIIIEAKETGKQTVQLKFKPKIAQAVALATKEANARGETMTDLLRSEAALPGLLDSVGQLKDLANVVTSTLGGKAFDFLVKESGFGATEGADARAKFVAIINNQVLPLLRQTFGAAFTEREGETLKATMGDPDSTPSQKILQLESFIDQKVRNIQASQRELGKEVTPAADLSTPAADSVLRFDAQGNQI